MSFPQRGYPIGALFVLVTACAVLVAGITPLLRLIQEGSFESGSFVVASLAGMFLGLVIGVILGLFQFRMGLGIVMGGAIGATLGVVAGFFSLLSGDQVVTAALAMTAGSGLIVIVAVVMRRMD